MYSFTNQAVITGLPEGPNPVSDIKVYVQCFDRLGRYYYEEKSVKITTSPPLKNLNEFYKEYESNIKT